ncbi:hypothetical protein [Alkalimonas amylolytica]|uniref:Transposase n=1 Tax=Alkalimonas amylolytica TaxID=152573 RepID=A0A1H4E159_ALKAM|nr:hypothetical protein [Alkalimonas amylolytica]SEA78488.1 hypothetical protein SAMN04488051_106141 [Alkalimonas amylolytica]
MNVRTILTNIVSFVTPKMHATRQKAVIDCVHSLANVNAATVTSIGRGIHSSALEKHNIKRADRLLSNAHLLREQTLVYAAICQLFCKSKHPTTIKSSMALGNERFKQEVEVLTGRRQYKGKAGRPRKDRI